MVFKPNRFKLHCPAVDLNGNIIEYVEKTKDLGYMFTNDKQDPTKHYFSDMLKTFAIYMETLKTT